MIYKAETACSCVNSNFDRSETFFVKITFFAILVSILLKGVEKKPLVFSCATISQQCLIYIMSNLVIMAASLEALR